MVPKVLFLRQDPPTQVRFLPSSVWMCDVPAEALERHGWETKSRSIHTIHPLHPDVGWADIIMLERHNFPFGLECTNYWQAHLGKHIKIRFDDAYHIMPKWLISWRQTWGVYQDGKPAIDAMVDHLKRSDGFSAPSKMLVNDYSKMAGMEGTYLPNYPNLLEFPSPKPHKNEVQYLTYGWGGSAPHKQSWQDSGAAEAINEFLPWLNHRFALLCNRPWFRETFSVRYASFEWCSIHEYRLRVRSVLDIGLAPLAGQYDRRRSWIKVLIYALLGIPWLASRDHPYLDCKGGLLVENGAENWLEALRAIQDPDLRKQLREEGLEWAWAQGIDDHIKEWVNWLEG